jgi:hypothetical protein
MKTFAQEQCRAEIVRRLMTVRADSASRWGRMSAHQMVCHLSDSFRMALGRKTAKDVGGVMQRTVVKWIALYVPVRWPTELVTVPEVDQQVGGTAPVEFAADLADLSELFELFTNRTRDDGNRRRPHPIFGRMSSATWLRWGYLHTDHHLRQFGL